MKISVFTIIQLSSLGLSIEVLQADHAIAHTIEAIKQEMYST